MKKLFVLSVIVVISVSGCFSTPAREVTNICNKEFIIYDGIEDADGVIYNGVDVRVWDFWDKFIISDKDKTILFFDSLTEDDRQVIIPTLPKISLYSFVKV